MYAPLCNGLRLSSTLNMITEEAMVITKNQGIVSILGSDSSTETKPTKAGASLRRTLSADMSSKKWLTKHGFSHPLKKIASSDEFPVSIINDSVEKRGQQLDIWNSIISSQKTEEEDSSNSAPYIHPLVRISATTLSEKSLAICTESLGSETGSDGFSSYSASETSSDIEEDNNINKVEEEQEQQQQQKQEIRVSCFDVNNVNVVRKSLLTQYRSFPPPIPSLSLKDGSSVRMKTHRDNGRLVVEAVSVTSQKIFFAQRQHGRLVLTFAKTINDPAQAESEVNIEAMSVEEEEEEEEFDSYGEEEDKESEIDSDEEEEEEEDRCCVMEKSPKLSINGAIMNVHRLAVMMNKPIWLAKRNPTWPENIDEIVKFGQGLEEEEKIESTSPPPPSPPLAPPRVARLIPLPSPPTAAAAAATTTTTTTTTAGSFNAYEYYWRRPINNQPMSKATIINSFAQQSQPPPLKNINSNKPLILSKNLMATDDHQQQLLVLRGNKGDYFVPLFKGCKEPRRSILFWEPCYCIATSS